MFLAVMTNVSDTLVRNHFRRQHVALVESSADINRASVRVTTAGDHIFWQRLTAGTVYPSIGCNNDEQDGYIE